jgi:hypothetical protein
MRKPIVILLADDDEEDRMLACDALTQSRLRISSWFSSVFPVYDSPNRIRHGLPQKGYATMLLFVSFNNEF